MLFFIDLRRIRSDDLFLESTSPLLPNDIRLELASLLKSNNKTAVKHQTLFCFIQKTPYQNEAKWTVSLFENVQGVSSPKWISPKILKKVDTLFLVWETLLCPIMQIKVATFFCFGRH